MRYRFDPPYPYPHPEHGRRPGPARDADLRASDAERTEVADRLSRHFADGRLDQVEFKARLDRAMGATIRGDLVGLFDDLPPLPDESPPPRRHRPLLALLVLAVLAAVVVASALPMIRVPWVLLVVVGLLVWHRLGRHHRRAGRTRELEP